MIQRESWYREASLDEEYSRILHELEGVDWTPEGDSYVPKNPDVYHRLDKLLKRLNIDPFSNLDKRAPPAWTRKYIFEFRHPGFKKRMMEMWDELWTTPWWKLLHSPIESVFKDTRRLGAALHSAAYVLGQWGYIPSHERQTLEFRYQQFQNDVLSVKRNEDYPHRLDDEKPWGENIGQRRQPDWYQRWSK